MEFVLVRPLKCLSNGHIFHVERELWDHLSHLTYDGEGEVAWPEHLDDLHALSQGMEDFNEIKVCSLLTHTHFATIHHNCVAHYLITLCTHSSSSMI